MKKLPFSEFKNRIIIGSENLIKKSSIRIETNGYMMGILELTDYVEDGTELTFIAWGKLPEGKSIYVSRSPSTSILGLAEQQLDGTYRCNFIFTIDQKYPTDTRNKLTLHNYPSSNTDFSGYIEKCKLVKGNLPTLDWSPAWEDLQFK